MELHNTAEDIVLQKVEEIFNGLEKEGNPEKFCTCAQCRMDTACYVLNRTTPYYIVSNRGAARVQQETVERQQKVADITTLIYDGIKRVNHNMRPNISHTARPAAGGTERGGAVFNIPTIMGRLFDGKNFAPVSGIKIELLRDNALVVMKDGNWQNPYHLDSHTEGNFTFWPVPVPAGGPDDRRVFEYAIRVETPEYETLSHVFRIPVISEYQPANSFTLERTFKLPDLFLFPPGESENNLYLD